MRFKWDFWDFVKEYLLKVVVLWAVLFSAFSGLVYLLTEFGLGRDIPREDWITIWISIVVVGIFFAQIVVYYRIARRQIPAERIEQALEAVATLREEGVKLRNVEWQKVTNKEELEIFKNQFLEWKQKLIPEVKIVSPSQAKIFEILDIVRFNVSIDDSTSEVKKELEKTLAQITDYTSRLKDFVDKFSIENLSNRVRK